MLTFEYLLNCEKRVGLRMRISQVNEKHVNKQSRGTLERQ